MRAIIRVIALVGAMCASVAHAAPEAISAEEARALAAAGEVVIVDVRHPDEWRQTGLPTGAEAVSIHDPEGAPGFTARLQAVMDANPGKTIAFICARGVRSARAADILASQGAPKVYNIREGMLGSPAGPGWLATGLDTAPCNC